MLVRNFEKWSKADNACEKFHDNLQSMSFSNSIWGLLSFSRMSTLLDSGIFKLGGAAFASHPGWQYGDSLRPARCPCAVTQLLRRYWLSPTKQGDVALAWRSGCHGIIADRHWYLSLQCGMPPIPLHLLNKSLTDMSLKDSGGNLHLSGSVAGKRVPNQKQLCLSEHSLDGQNRQSPIASVQRTRSTLASHSAVPRGRNVNEWTPIARFESQHNERRVCEDYFLCF